MNCPACKKEMTSADTAIICNECLKKLAERTTLEDRQPAPQGVVGWTCPVCGRGNAPWSPSCSCGGHGWPSAPAYPANPGWPSDPYRNPWVVPTWDQPTITCHCRGPR